ncbi:MAG: O-antigen ligase family protein, partial [Candidatus Uhrbacteria bacterium]|nr:O-antigen ligase family protein [Candidatus Uhrbacteria bacterium]
EPKWKDYRTQLSILLVLALPALALTYSRSAWFGFVLGFFFISVWAMRDRRVIVATSLAVGSIALYLAFTGLVVNRLIDVSDQSISERFFEAFSYARWQGEYSGFGRVYWMLLTPLEVIPASPIFGHGPATFGGGAVAALGNSEVYDELGLPFGVYGTEGYIDNNWFSLWGETGTLGFGLYLWIYIALFLTCIRVWRKSKDPLTRALAIGTAATMISIAFNAVLGTNLEVRTLASYLWVFPAIVIVQADRENLL